MKIFTMRNALSACAGTGAMHIATLGAHFAGFHIGTVGMVVTFGVVMFTARERMRR